MMLNKMYKKQFSKLNGLNSLLKAFLILYEIIQLYIFHFHPNYSKSFASKFEISSHLYIYNILKIFYSDAVECKFVFKYIYFRNLLFLLQHSLPKITFQLKYILVKYLYK